MLSELANPSKSDWTQLQVQGLASLSVVPDKNAVHRAVTYDIGDFSPKILASTSFCQVFQCFSMVFGSCSMVFGQGHLGDVLPVIIKVASTTEARFWTHLKSIGSLIAIPLALRASNSNEHLLNSTSMRNPSKSIISIYKLTII